MKKVISTVASLALAAVMATSAFAASSEELKGYAAEYYNTYNGKSYGVSLDAVYSAIDALPDANAVDVAAVKAAADTAKAELDKADSQAAVKAAIEKAFSAGEAAVGEENAKVISLGDVNVSLALDGSFTVSASVNVNGITVTASKTTAADPSKAPTYTDSSKKDTTTATSGAAASTAGVIKATGLNTTGAAVVALAVASVLGVAAVKARKLGE